MARVTVRVVGRERLIKRLKSVLLDTRDGVREEAEEAANRIQRRAKEFVPVDTGRLRDSIRVTQTGKASFNVGPGDEVEYAEYVEFGTSRSPAQPYMRPALEAERREFPAAVRRRVRTEMD